MTLKTAVLNVKIEPELKENATNILDELGLSSSEAIRLFYKQIILNKGLPFAVRIPNAATLNAVEEARTGAGTKHTSKDDLFDSWDNI